MTPAGWRTFTLCGTHLSFISNLARGGVHPKVTRQLARHSTITLTMDRYSHTSRGELSDALSALPGLAIGQQAERAVASGTDGKSLPISLPTNLPRRAALVPEPVASDCTQTLKMTAGTTRSGYAENTAKTGVSCTSSHSPAPQNGEGGTRSDAIPQPLPGLEFIAQPQVRQGLRSSRRYSVPPRFFTVP